MSAIGILIHVYSLGWLSLKVVLGVWNVFIYSITEIYHTGFNKLIFNTFKS